MYTLLFNGNICTLESANPKCSALLIQNNRIVYCGDEQDINLPDALVNRIDLNNKTVLPAFIDCHTHFSMAAKKYDQISLDHCLTFEKTLKEIKTNIPHFSKGTWIKGGGWNMNLWNGLIPNKDHLDSITIDHPVALFNKDLHTMWLNSLALKKCGLDSNIPSHFSNKIRLDSDGNPSGLVYEDVCHLVEEISTENSESNQEENIVKFSEALLQKGITSAHSMENLDDFDLFMKLHLNENLKTRLCFHPPAEEVETLVKSKIHSGYGNEWLRVGGLKYYVDGSMGSQTAEMFEDYLILNYSGVEILTQDQLTQKINFAASKGLGATVHAIGDKAIHKTLNAFEHTRQKAKTSVPLRHRIEHSQIIAPTDLPRFTQMGIIASMQPLHIADDVKINEKFLGKRAKLAYPINSLLRSGTKVVFGSDTPVADFDPFKAILAANTRKYNLDPKEKSAYPEQKISLKQGIYAYTKDAAFSSYEESIKGSLLPGKLADLVVFSKDLMRVKDPEQVLPNIEVLATILDGKIVYKNNNVDF